MILPLEFFGDKKYPCCHQDVCPYAWQCTASVSEPLAIDEKYIEQRDGKLMRKCPAEV